MSQQKMTEMSQREEAASHSTMFMVVWTSWIQSYMWHKTRYGFWSRMQFFNPSKAKTGYSCL